LSFFIQLVWSCIVVLCRIAHMFIEDLIISYYVVNGMPKRMLYTFGICWFNQQRLVIWQGWFSNWIYSSPPCCFFSVWLWFFIILDIFPAVFLRFFSHWEFLWRFWCHNRNMCHDPASTCAATNEKGPAHDRQCNKYSFIKWDKSCCT